MGPDSDGSLALRGHRYLQRRDVACVAALDNDNYGHQVYRLLGLVKKWGDTRVEEACRRALEAEAVDVNLVSRMIERARELTEPDARPDPVVIQGRFARDPSEFSSTSEAGR